MHISTQNFTAANTIFGNGYIFEQHSDAAHRNIGPSEKHKFVADFAEMLRALRAALSLR